MSSHRKAPGHGARISPDPSREAGATARAPRPPLPRYLSVSACVSLSLSACLSVSVSSSPSPFLPPPFLPLSLRPDNKHAVARSPSSQLVRLKNPQVLDAVGKNDLLSQRNRQKRPRLGFHPPPEWSIHTPEIISQAPGFPSPLAPRELLAHGKQAFRGFWSLSPSKQPSNKLAVHAGDSGLTTIADSAGSARLGTDRTSCLFQVVMFATLFSSLPWGHVWPGHLPRGP